MSTRGPAALVPPDADRRDPEFIRRQMPWFSRVLEAWYQPEVMGLEQVPDGRALVVGTHNGGAAAPDMYALMLAFWKRLGPDRPAYGLAHDVALRVPLIGPSLARMGAVPAHPQNAAALLEQDALVLVYPGGDLDAYKSFRDRHVVTFGKRRGFIRVAIRAQAPIVPVVSVGAHEIFYVLTDGGELARRLRLKELARVEVLPIILALPTGLVVSTFVPYFPVPSRVRVRLLPPIDLGLPPEAADDESMVDRVTERVRSTMQAALDDLVAEGGFGVRARFATLPAQRRA